MLDTFDFLSAYAPAFICPPCLAAVMDRDVVEIGRFLDLLITAKRAESACAECMNCGTKRTVMRLRAAPPPPRLVPGS